MAGKKKLPVIMYDDNVVDPDNQTNAFKGMPCQGCALETKGRFCGEGASGEIDIMLVSESPSSWTINNQSAFYGRGGRVIRSTWKELLAQDLRKGEPLKMRHMRKWETYAVQCQVESGREQETASAATINRCSTAYLHSAIKNKKPKIIIAFGATALKALGYKLSGFMEARGRVVDLIIGGHAVKVLPTFSTKHIQAKTGLYNLFCSDFNRALRIAAGLEDLDANVTIEELSKNYVIPKTLQAVAALCDTIINYVVEGAKTAAQCALSIDTETNTVNVHREDAKILCVSVAWDTGKSCAIPLHHPGSPWTEDELPKVIQHIRRVLECPKPKTFHNAKFDLKFFERRYKWQVNNVAWDTLLGEHLLREDMSGNYSLKILGRSYFPAFGNYADKIHELAEAATPNEEGILAATEGVRKGKIKPMPGIEDGMVGEMSKKELDKYLFGDAKSKKNRQMDAGYERVPLEDLLLYAAIDTDLTRRLMRHQFGRMAAEGFPQARSLMATHCLPASRALGDMEFEGFPVDRPYLEKIEIDLNKIVSEKEAEMSKYWNDAFAESYNPYPPYEGYPKPPHVFNPNSTADIGTILFNKGVKNVTTGKRELREGPWLVRNKKGTSFKTDKKTLKAIAVNLNCPFAKAILEYRGAHKALTGFVKEIKVLSELDSKVHPNFHLHGTSTGRLASTKPNAQNQPKKIAGINIKKIFVPEDPENEVIFNLDVKSAEIRVFTAYAPDAALIKALNEGYDVHSWFTQEIFGIPYEEVEAKKDIDVEMGNTRRTVKSTVFGTLYGAMAKKISETAGVSLERAQEIIDKLFQRFTSLEDYMNGVVTQVHTVGYVDTLFGRRRRFPLQGANGFFRGQAERRAKNYKIQSTSSDIVISQLIETHEKISQLGGRMCITVHDSIVGIIPKKALSKAKAFFEDIWVKRVSEKYPWLPVKFEVDLGVGPSYGETIPIEAYIEKNGIVEANTDEFLAFMDSETEAELRMTEEEEQEAAAKEYRELTAAAELRTN